LLTWGRAAVGCNDNRLHDYHDADHDCCDHHRCDNHDRELVTAMCRSRSRRGRRQSG